MPFLTAATPMPMPTSCDPGKAHRIDVRRRGDRGTDLRAGPHHQIEDAGRQPGALQDVDEGPRRGGRQLRRLEDHAVGKRERRRNLPRRDSERKIPGRDQPDHANWLARDVDFDAGPHGVELVTTDPHCFASEVLEDGAGTAGFTHRIGERLAHLARQLASEFLLARQNLGTGAIENVESLLRIRHRPLGERLLR